LICCFSIFSLEYEREANKSGTIGTQKSKSNGKRVKKSGKKHKAKNNDQKEKASTTKGAAKKGSKGGKKNKTKKNKKDKKKKKNKNKNKTKKMNYTDAAYLVGGVFREMQGKMADDFINCFKGINGTAIYKAPKKT